MVYMSMMKAYPYTLLRYQGCLYTHTDICMSDDVHSCMCGCACAYAQLAAVDQQVCNRWFLMMNNGIANNIPTHRSPGNLLSTSFSTLYWELVTHLIMFLKLEGKYLTYTFQSQCFYYWHFQFKIQKFKKLPLANPYYS